MIPTPLYEMELLQNIIIMTGLELYHNNSRPLLSFIITELSSCSVVLCYEIISVGKATYVTLSWSQGWLGPKKERTLQFRFEKLACHVGMVCENWCLRDLATNFFCWPVVSGPVKLIGNCHMAPNQHHLEHRGWPVRLLQQAPGQVWKSSRPAQAWSICRLTPLMSEPFDLPSGELT